VSSQPHLLMTPEAEAALRVLADAPRDAAVNEGVIAILQQIKAGIDRANANGIVCDYPETVEIDGEKYSFDRALICFAPRVITRVMDDGIKTKDGTA
jgi:hypothetical protein